MKIIRPLFTNLLGLVNVLIGIGFLATGFSPYISPITHPVMACAGLFFPFFILLNLGMLLLWIMYRWKMSLIPIVFFIIGWEPLTTYIPFNLYSENYGKESFKVLSYNVMGLNPEEGYIGKSAIEYILESGADIVCMQEYPADSKKFDEQLGKVYPYHKDVQIALYNHQVCFSKYPITSARKADYESDFNGSTIFKIKKGKESILLINNHLESNKINEEDKKMYKDMINMPDEEKMKSNGKHLLVKLAEAVAIRAQQANSIAQLIKENKNSRIIVCGDFNDSPISYTHRIISQDLTDAYKEKGRGPGFSYNRSFMFFRIDNIMVSKNFKVHKCKVDRTIEASDHYPIWCEIE